MGGSSFSMVFIRWEVRSAGLYWFSSLACIVFGTGTTREVFHRSGTFCRLRLRLKMYVTISQSWSAQSLSSLGLLLSGPAVFLFFSCLRSLLTWSTARKPESGTRTSGEDLSVTERSKELKCRGVIDE